MWTRECLRLLWVVTFSSNVTLFSWCSQSISSTSSSVWCSSVRPSGSLSVSTYRCWLIMSGGGYLAKTSPLVLLYISLLLMQTPIKCNIIWLNRALLHFAAGIWADLWWAVQDSMTQQPSWMLTFWPSVKKRAGANWRSTSCHSSTISTGKIEFFLGRTLKTKQNKKNRASTIDRWQLKITNV